jgi:hypothetical protein
MPRYREFARTGAAVQRTWTAPHGNSTMFKILELKGADSAAAAQVGQHRYPTREEALAAVKKHLKTFNVSGHNPEGNYWWARDAEGLRKCWISNAD